MFDNIVPCRFGLTHHNLPRVQVSRCKLDPHFPPNSCLKRNQHFQAELVPLTPHEVGPAGLRNILVFILTFSSGSSTCPVLGADGGLPERQCRPALRRNTLHRGNGEEALDGFRVLIVETALGYFQSAGRLRRVRQGTACPSPSADLRTTRRLLGYRDPTAVGRRVAVPFLRSTISQLGLDFCTSVCP